MTDPFDGSAVDFSGMTPTAPDKLEEIKAIVADVKRGAGFPSCERADTDLRWLVAALEAERIENIHLREAFVVMERAYNETEAKRLRDLDIQAKELAYRLNVQAALAAERIENTRLREAFVTMEKAYNAHEAQRCESCLHMRSDDHVGEPFVGMAPAGRPHFTYCKRTKVPIPELGTQTYVECRELGMRCGAWLASEAKARLT